MVRRPLFSPGRRCGRYIILEALNIPSATVQSYIAGTPSAPHDRVLLMCGHPRPTAPSGEDFHSRAQRLARAVPPGAPRFRGFGVHERIGWIAVDYDPRCVRLPFWSAKELPRLLHQLASELCHYADQGFLHGDLHPLSIAVDPNGRSHILQTGFHELFTDDNGSSNLGLVPERYRGGRISSEGDVFSLSLIMADLAGPRLSATGDEITDSTNAILRWWLELGMSEAPSMRPSMRRLVEVGNALLHVIAAVASSDRLADAAEGPSPVAAPPHGAAHDGLVDVATEIKKLAPDIDLGFVFTEPRNTVSPYTPRGGPVTRREVERALQEALRAQEAAVRAKVPDTQRSATAPRVASSEVDRALDIPVVAPPIEVEAFRASAGMVWDGAISSVPPANCPALPPDRAVPAPPPPPPRNRKDGSRADRPALRPLALLLVAMAVGIGARSDRALLATTYAVMVPTLPEADAEDADDPAEDAEAISPATPPAPRPQRPSARRARLTAPRGERLCEGYFACGDEVNQ